jgi:S-adenosylmethionine:tRNA ribosyltransferase-isomerase
MSVEHRYFSELPTLLQPGDVVVVNTSATLAASIPAISAAGQPAAVHLSGRLPGGLWMVEVRHRVELEHRGDDAGDTADDPSVRPGGAPTRTSATRPWLDAREGELFLLPGGGTVRLRLPLGDDVDTPLGVEGPTAHRLWVATVALPGGLLPYLARHGRPIRYTYVPQDWPMSSYQTVFAEEPGSAEMPSAARPFSTEVTTRLVARGVIIAPFVLHCAVSSLETHEPPAPEWYRIPSVTAAHVNQARASGHRVIAVGTTAVRALETVAERDGTVHPGEGWTELVIGKSSRIRALDGLITGWHEPGASHLALLEAVAGPELVSVSYREALRSGYLWHEFGDSHLILP